MWKAIWLFPKNQACDGWNGGDDGRPKAWYKDLADDELDAEQEFLETNVYGGKRQLPVDTINAFNRFSARI